MLVKCYDKKMAKLPGDSFYRDLHMRQAKKKKKNFATCGFLLKTNKKLSNPQTQKTV